jgi:transmembrane 9 superfamily protein 2/4
MLENTTCNVLCTSQVPGNDAVFMNQLVKEQYLLQWMIDGLPVSQKNEQGRGYTIPGFQLGYQEKLDGKEQVMLNNHYEIYIMYHPRPDATYRVVGAYVNPSSVKSEKCIKKDPVILSELDMNTFPYTYDVYWIESNIPWGSRWDHYLYSGDDKIHWFSVINSLIVVVLLSAIVFGILIRALRKDIVRYNDIDMEDSHEEFGWKLVHGDVFRSPIHRMVSL